MKTNIYYNEICNANFWGKKFDYVASANHGTRKAGNGFIDGFLNGDEGAEISEFEAYMAWLLQLGEDSNTNGYLELLISNPYDRRAAGLSFTNIQSLHRWVENNQVPPTNIYTTSPGGYCGP